MRDDEGVRGPNLLLAAVVALALAAAAVFALPSRRQDGFQELVHGLGLGAATDLSRCAAAFDPRDGRACSLRHDPVPCGSLFCPAHATGD